MNKHTTTALKQNLLSRSKRLLFQLATCLKHIPDPRSPRGVRYALWQVLGLVVLAKLAGQDTIYGMAQWALLRQEWLAPIFDLKNGRIPHHTTIHRVLRKLPTQTVEQAVRCFAQMMNRHQKSATALRLLAFDGKTLRGTHLSDGTSLHLLSVYQPTLGASLGQVSVAKRKENEIVQAPNLLKTVPLKDAVVMGDALHTQRSLSQWLLEQGAHYIWIVKSNHKRLYSQLQGYFNWLEQKGRHLRLHPPQWEEAQIQNKNHGRLEIRRILVSAEALEGIQWPGAVRGFCVTYRYRKSDEAEFHEDKRYGITSAPADLLNASLLLEMVREYWKIENSLHHRRDVTFREDTFRTRWSTLGQVVAALNNIAITLFNQLQFTNHAQARRWFEVYSKELAWQVRLGIQAL